MRRNRLRRGLQEIESDGHRQCRRPFGLANDDGLRDVRYAGRSSARGETAPGGVRLQDFRLHDTVLTHVSGYMR